MKTSFFSFKADKILEVGDTIEFYFSIIDERDGTKVEIIPIVGTVSDTLVGPSSLYFTPTTSLTETAQVVQTTLVNFLKSNSDIVNVQLLYGINPFDWEGYSLNELGVININSPLNNLYIPKVVFNSSDPAYILMDNISEENKPEFDYIYNLNYELTGCNNAIYNVDISDGVGPFKIESPYELMISGNTVNITIPRGVVNQTICIRDLGANITKCKTISNNPISYNRDIFNIVFNPDTCEITVTPLVDISTIEPLEYMLEGDEDWQSENVIRVPSCDPEVEVLIRDVFGCIMVASVNGTASDYSDVLWVRSPQWVVDDNRLTPIVDEMNINLSVWSGNFDVNTNPTLPTNFSLRTIYFNNEASINISDYIRDFINPTMHIDYNDLDNPIRYNDEGVFYSLSMEGANDYFSTGIATLGYGYHEEGYNPHPTGSGSNINNTAHRYYIDDLVPRTTSFSTIYTNSSSIFWRGPSSNVETKGIICKKGNYNFGIFYLNKLGLWDFIPFNYFSTQEIERKVEDTYTRKSTNYNYPINMFGKQKINTSSTTKYNLNTPILDASYNERITEMLNSTRWYLYRNDLDDSYVRQSNPQDWLWLKPVVLTNDNFNLVGGNRNGKYQWSATFELANNLINDIS